MFSSDPTIVRWQSPACQRMKEYGELFDKLFIFLLIRERAPAINISDKIQVKVFSGRITRFISCAAALYKIVKKEDISVITTQEIEHALIVYILKPVLRAKWQMQIHTDIFSPYYAASSFLNYLRGFIGKFLIPRADSIRVVSERIKHSIIKIFPSAKLNITVLPIFVDTERFSKLLPSFDLHEKYKKFSFIILMVSRISHEKNIGLALEAFAQVVKKEPNAGLVIVGNGPELGNFKSQSASWRTNLKLDDKTRFEGWVDDLASYYKSADLYLLTSDFEGYGRTVIEALACNLPVLMTDVGVAGEVVIDRNNGLIVPVGESMGIAAEILRLIQDKKAYEELKKNSCLLAPMPSKEEYLRKFKESLEMNGNFN